MRVAVKVAVKGRAASGRHGDLDEEGVAMVAAIAAELAATKLVAVAAHTDRFLSAPGVHVRLAA